MLEKGTVIEMLECGGCGAPVPLKVNGKGNLYAFCGAVLERDENGKCIEQCMTNQKFGRTASKRLINQYLENQKELEDVQPERRKEEPTRRKSSAGVGDNTEPELEGGPVTAGGRGFGSKLRGILGDGATAFD